jgi:AraC-like DNA-binding protein
MIVQNLTADKFLLSEIAVSRSLKGKGLESVVSADHGEASKSAKRVLLLDLRDALASAAADLKSNSFGLTFASEFNSPTIALLGHAMKSSTSTFLALKFCCNHLALVVDHLHVECRTAGSVFEIVLSYPPLMDDWDQFIDFDASLVVRLIRKCLGASWTPAYVNLHRKEPHDTTEHALLFGKRVTYASGKTLIAVPKECLPQNPDADKSIFDLIEHQCAIELRKFRDTVPLKTRVQIEILRRIPQEEISLSCISNQFNMSVRNFQRRLAIEGTSFECVIETTRKELSSHLLKDNTIAISRISDLLGYSSPNAYSRAAKLWYQMPPSEQRLAFRWQAHNTTT